MSANDTKNENKIVELHGKLCDEFTKRLNRGEKVVSKEGEEFFQDCSAATLKEIRQFLLDNKIEALLETSRPLKRLVSNLPFPKE
jgi:hypothetical protein